jgi:hypothetical protein
LIDRTLGHPADVAIVTEPAKFCWRSGRIGGPLALS